MNVRSQLWALALVAGLATSCCLAFLAGCASEAAPVTSASSKYRPAGEGAESPAPEVASGTPASETPVRVGGEQPVPIGKAPATTPPQATAAGEIAVPDGDVKSLVAFINQLSQFRPKSQDERGQLQEVLQVQQAQLIAAEKILAQKPDKETRQMAMGVVYRIHRNLMEFGIPGARAKFVEFAQGLAKDADPDLSKMGRYSLFDVNVSQITGQPLADGEEVLAEIKQLLDSEKDAISADALELASSAAAILMQNGLKDDAMKAFGLIAAAAKESKDEKVAASARRYEDRARLLKADIATLLTNLISDEKDAGEKLVAGVKQLLTEVEPSPEVFANLQEIGQILELTGNSQAALQCLDHLEAAFKDSADKDLAGKVAAAGANARKRLSLVGQPFNVEGLTMDGKPLDWSAYQGKVVLVDFWATWCGPCMEELPNIEKNYHQFKPLGFEVVGVNLDASLETVKEFFSLQQLPWTTVVSPDVYEGKLAKDPPPTYFTSLPMPAKCGVEALPFLVLVGKDGKVDSIHVRGPKLRSRLVALLGEPEPAPAPEKPAKEAPGNAIPKEENPAAPADEKPDEKTPPEKNPAEKNPAERGVLLQRSSTRIAAVGSLAIQFARTILAADPAPSTANDSAINPYAAKPGLTSDQLAAYIQKMLDKPKTIQARPGFTEAVSEACDRILNADPPAREIDQFIAAESKFEALHKKACAGDDAADKLLVAFVEKMKADERPRIARQVAFFQEERKVLDAVNGPASEIDPLIKELKDFFAKEKLAARHLRMASTTVALINKLADGDQREKHFAEFGATFAKSSDKELARYGKKLAKKPAASQSDLVGKPLEIAGTTAKGADFVWDAYRGKVVLVDFWATWCGPCRKEMPNVKALREKHLDRGLDVVGISLDQDQEALADYLEENDIPWETLAGDGTQELAEKYGVRGIPTMMAIDKEGKIAAVAHNVAALESVIEKLLK